MATLDDVRHLEAELEQTRKAIAAFLKAERMKRGLSLRQAARRIRIMHTTLMTMENGETWRTSTVARALRFYERTNGDGKTPKRTASRA